MPDRPISEIHPGIWTAWNADGSGELGQLVVTDDGAVVWRPHWRPVPATLPNLTVKPATISDCGCPTNHTCMNTACPRAARVTCSTPCRAPNQLCQNVRRCQANRKCCFETVEALTQP